MSKKKEKPEPVFTRIKGLHTYKKANGEEFQAIEATFMDYGNGEVSRVFTLPPAYEATPEEKKARREQVARTITEIMQNHGIWP